MADPSNEVANPGTETYADKVEYTMDEVHNLSSLKVTPYGGSAATTNFTSNAMNEYTAVGGTTHVYDSNGNLTDDGVNLYSYDFHNHLVKVVDKGTSTTIAEYEYDAVGRGRRTAKVVGSNTTRFIYHGQHVLEELDGSDTLLRLFAYADGWDNVVMMEAEDVADVDNDANTTELKRFYYHTQLIGSITHITDDDEVVVESYEYDAYGNTTIYDINSSSVSASQIENPYMYTARRMDEESGLYHYRARAYSPKLRRFIQRDPLEYVDGPNAMAYVGGMPTRAMDPEGLESAAVDAARQEREAEETQKKADELKKEAAKELDKLMEEHGISVRDLLKKLNEVDLVGSKDAGLKMRGRGPHSDVGEISRRTGGIPITLLIAVRDIGRLNKLLNFILSAITLPLGNSGSALDALKKAKMAYDFVKGVKATVDELRKKQDERENERGEDGANDDDDDDDEQQAKLEKEAVINSITAEFVARITNSRPEKK